MDGELGGLVDLALEFGRVLDARDLQQDAVVALAHDGRFDGAGLVDAAAQDLDRLVDHFLALAHHVDVGIADTNGVARARDRQAGIEGAQPFDGLRALCLVTQHEHDRAAGLDVDRLEGDLLLAHLAAHRVGQVGQPLVHHAAQVRLEQEVRTAAQVEAEIDAALLVPARQGADDGVGQHVRQRQEPGEQRDSDDGDGLPARKIEHPDLTLVVQSYI